MGISCRNSSWGPQAETPWSILVGLGLELTKAGVHCASHEQPKLLNNIFPVGGGLSYATNLGAGT